MKMTHAVLAAALCLALPLGACGQKTAIEAEGEATEAADYERGPHNGRMLRDGNFALEVTIFEDGVPPEYRIYAYRDDKPIPPGEVAVTVTLKRLDGETNLFNFVAENDYLRGNGEVTEPHSFDVAVVAREGGRVHRWQ